MVGFIRPFGTASDYTLQFTSHVFTSRCLLAASNGGRSPSSGFRNYPQASATSF
jgi:hypothetical protein